MTKEERLKRLASLLRSLTDEQLEELIRQAEQLKN